MSEIKVRQLAGGCVLYHPNFRPGVAAGACAEQAALPPEPSIMPFGKYLGAPLDAVVDDVNYASWLLAQPWFSEKFPRHRDYLAAALERTLADADGNPAGRRRDDGPEAA